MMHKVVPVAAFHAQMIPVDWRLLSGCDADDPVIFDVQFKLAAHAAIGAGGHHNFIRHACADGHFIIQCAGGAVGNTGAAGFTARAEQVRICSGDWMGIKSPFSHAPDEASLNIGTGADTSRALDAFVQVDPDEWVGITIYWIVRFGRCAFFYIQPVMVYPVHELGFLLLSIRVSIIVIIGHKHFKDGFARLFDIRAVGLNLHVFDDSQSTGCHWSAPAFYIHHAKAAAAISLKIRVVTQGGNSDPGFLCDLQYGHPFGRLYILSV